MDAKYYADKLDMLPHPEGGFYKENYRAAGMVGDRHYSTAIYFLLTENNFSALHRIKSDEVWHFYTGNAITIAEISEKGELIETQLGPDIEKGELFQYVVKAGHWFGSFITSNRGFALVGCTVAPGFDFKDFEMAQRDDLMSLYPQHATLVDKLSRI